MLTSWYIPKMDEVLKLKGDFMQRFTEWMESKFVPIASRIGSQKHLVSIRDAFISLMPVTMPGAIAVMLNAIVRDLPIQIQAKHLFATGLIDDVIIGNAYASDEELEILSNINRYQLEFEVIPQDDITHIEKTIVFENQHINRGDINYLVLLSTQNRVIYKNEDNPAKGVSNFKRGDVLVGNNTFGRYKNETQVVLEGHDDRKNKVEEIHPQEIFLLDYVYPWSKFKLVKSK